MRGEAYFKALLNGERRYLADRLLLAILLLGYALLTQLVKTWFIRRFGE